MNETRTLRTHICGISKNQDAASRVHAGDKLFLGRDIDNHHDPNAIGVVNNSYQLVGYIDKECAKELAPLIDRNEIGGLCYASDITGDYDTEIGISLLLVIGDVSTLSGDLEAFASEILDVPLRNNEETSGFNPEAYAVLGIVFVLTGILLLSLEVNPLTIICFIFLLIVGLGSVSKLDLWRNPIRYEANTL